MGSILNFVYSDNFLVNGHEISTNKCRFHRGPFNKYIQDSTNITHTVNYQISKKSFNFFLIEVDHMQHIFNDSITIFDMLPIQFIDKIRDGDVTLIITSVAESSTFDDMFFNKLEHKLNTLGISSNKVHLIDSNYDITTYKNNFNKYHSLHYIVTDNFNKLGNNDLNYVSEVPVVDDVLNGVIRNKHFLSLNRQSRPHRYILLSHIHKNNLYDKVHLSYLTNPSSLGVPNEFKSTDIETKIKIPLELDTFSIYNKSGFFSGDTLSNHYLDSYFNITTETYFFEKISTFSEKIIKPIEGLQPFIVLGTFQYLNKLKSLGFKTFDSIWDESYDNIEDGIDRITKILNVIDEISSWDIAHCDKIYKSVLDICIYNRNHLHGIYDDDEFGKILNKIINVSKKDTRYGV